MSEAGYRLDHSYQFLANIRMVPGRTPALLRLMLIVVIVGLLPGAWEHRARAQQGFTVSGMIWLDLDGSGRREPDNPAVSDALVYTEVAGQPSNSGGSGRSGAAGLYVAGPFQPGPHVLRAAVIDPTVPGSRMALISPPQSVTVTADMTGVDLGLEAPAATHDERYLAETGYRLDNDRIWGYFRTQGGVSSFGYPVSRALPLDCCWVQIFQRHVLQIGGTGNVSVHPLNLLDPGLMPITSVNFSTFPAYDPAIARAAPPPSQGRTYEDAVVAFLDKIVPNEWEGESIRFLDTYLGADLTSGAMQSPLFGLELWGFPTSNPGRDPQNPNLVYQRFQRGILRYDVINDLTDGMLVGDLFKSILTRENLPTDAEMEMKSSPYLGLLARDNLSNRREVSAALAVGLMAFVPE